MTKLTQAQKDRKAKAQFMLMEANLRREYGRATNNYNAMAIGNLASDCIPASSGSELRRLVDTAREYEPTIRAKLKDIENEKALDMYSDK